MRPLKPKTDPSRKVPLPAAAARPLLARAQEHFAWWEAPIARQPWSNRAGDIAWERARVRAARAGLAKGPLAKRERRKRLHDKLIPEVVRLTLRGEPAKIIAADGLEVRVSVRTVGRLRAEARARRLLPKK